MIHESNFSSAIAKSDIDDIIFEWYRWSKSFREPLGYHHRDSSCRACNISKQWMDHSELSEIVDLQIRQGIGEKLDEIIFEMTPRHRVAITVAMKNMDMGSKIWHHPKYPTCKISDYYEARDLVREKMLKKGLAIFLK